MVKHAVTFNIGPRIITPAWYIIHLVLDMTTEFGHFGHFRYHLVSYDTRRAVKVG